MVTSGKKSTVNAAGNYTKPSMRKRIFNSVKAAAKVEAPASGRPVKHSLLPLAIKKQGEGTLHEMWK